MTARHSPMPASWPATTLRRWATQARACQLDALQQMQALDAATQRHMAHGAMAGGDPLTDSLFEQADAAAACAVEGAQPAVSTGAWLTPQQLAALAATQADDWWLDWFIPAAVTGVVLLAAASVAGVFG
jgi:hypothetical protein